MAMRAQQREMVRSLQYVPVELACDKYGWELVWMSSEGQLCLHFSKLAPFITLNMLAMYNPHAICGNETVSG